MSLASLLKEINLIKESPKLKVASRIHVFYEGLVTEKELIDFYHQSIRVHKDIFLFVDISDGGSYNSLTNIVSILRDQVYEDVHGDIKKILPHDQVLYLFDMDVYFDFDFGRNPGNENRVHSMLNKFNALRDELISYQEDVSFIMVPSFPSIEYSICLGVVKELKGSFIHKANIEYYFRELEQVLGHKVSRNRKSFKTILNNRKVFNLNRMFKFSVEDRLAKKLPQDIHHLNKLLLNKHDFLSRLSENVPFTYFDAFPQIYQETINRDND